LRRHSPSSAAICRAGGEEFLVAVTAPPGGSEELATQLCRAVAELPHVTASIGISSKTLDSIRHRDSESVIDELIVTADAAMYVAKRSGGNRVQSG
jgi:GGDEF domain-containing protein